MPERLPTAVREAGVKAIIEPSTSTPLNPDIAELRALVKKGVLGDILWFSLALPDRQNMDRR